MIYISQDEFDSRLDGQIKLKLDKIGLKEESKKQGKNCLYYNLYQNARPNLVKKASQTKTIPDNQLGPHEYYLFNSIDDFDIKLNMVVLNIFEAAKFRLECMLK